MWSALEKISEQVTKYSSFLGKLWYVLVFLFRLIVVATIGNSVYGDEQSAFRCSQKLSGCSNMCYNEFTRISHMRFWAFQLLAVTTPTVIFHFFSTHVSGEIEKVKASRKNFQDVEEGDAGRITLGNSMSEGDILKMTKRMKSVGQIKVRRVYSHNELKEVPYTKKIKQAYYVCIIFRIVLEGVFIYLGNLLFQHMETKCENPVSSSCHHALDFLWLSVPGFYRCRGLNNSTRIACSTHFSQGRVDGFVPCFVSRPFEKTVFLRYMMILSSLCFIISIADLLVISTKAIWKASLARRKKKRRCLKYQDLQYATPANPVPSSIYKDDSLYQGLGVAVRMEKKESRRNIDHPYKFDEDKDTISINPSMKSYV